MKQIAILDYLIMFDPSETWSSGSQFEANLADFFAAYGYEAQVVEPKGNSGKRVIYLEKVPNTPEIREQPKASLTQQVRQLQKQPPKVGTPQNPRNLTRPTPKLSFQVGKSNRQKVTGDGSYS